MQKKEVTKLKEYVKNLKNWFWEVFELTNYTTAALAAVLSFLTTFALLFCQGEKLYQHFPNYSELIVGLTTFSGYPKQADMTVICVVLFGIVLFFAAYVFLQNLWKKYMRVDERISLGFLILFFVYFAAIFAEKNGTVEVGQLLFGAFVLALPLYFQHREKLENYLNLLLILLFLEYSYFGLCTALSMANSGLHNLVIAFFPWGKCIIFLVVLALGFYVRSHPVDAHLNKALFASQLLIPLCLTGFYRFNYLYEGTGEVIQLFYSSRWKYLCLCSVLAMLGFSFFCWLKKKSGIMLTSVLAIAMTRVFALPEAMLNVDFFHNGEITVPMQQLISFGKIPYVDLVPIHGLCDYYYGLINYLFFDGSYLALNSAVVVGNLLMCCLLTVTIYLCVEQKQQAIGVIYFFAPFFILTAGMRYLFLFILFFVLGSEKVRKSALRYLWCWVFFSILAIAWNASLGGSAAIAFLPVVLYRLYRDGFAELKCIVKPGDEAEKKAAVKTWIGYGILLVVGLCFIPLFLQIVVYLRENTATTLETNGMGMIGNLSRLSDYFVPGLITETEDFFLQTFGLVIPLLLCLFCFAVQQDKRRRSRAGEFSVVLLICYYVIANYAFVRYDNGLRTGVIGLFFLLFMVVYLLNGKNQEVGRTKVEAGLLFAVCGLCFYLADDGVLLIQNQVLPTGKVEASAQMEISGTVTEDPIVYVSGDSVGIRNLGTGFISGNALNSLKNIQAVLTQTVGEQGSYVDLTNGIANYVIFNQASVLRYTSGYNISNDLMQEKAVEVLKAENPQLILLAPFIKFDDAPLSLRSPKVYEYIMQAGYQPYCYENVIYLLRDTIPVPGSVEGTNALAGLMHKETLQYLPAVWGGANLDETLKEVKVDGSYIQGENELAVDFKTGMEGKEVSYIKLQFPIREQEVLLEALSQMDALQKGLQTDGEAQLEELDLSQLKHLVLSFESGVGGETVTRNFTAYLYGDTYLIPVGSSPYWKEENIEGFRICLEGTEEVLTDCAVSYYK